MAFLWKIMLNPKIYFAAISQKNSFFSKRNVWIEPDFPEECHFLYLLVFHACFYFDTFWCCELFYFSFIYPWKSGFAVNNRTCYDESIHICEGMYSNLEVLHPRRGAPYVNVRSYLVDPMW